jgi:hypothetical protein
MSQVLSFLWYLGNSEYDDSFLSYLRNQDRGRRRQRQSINDILKRCASNPTVELVQAILLLRGEFRFISSVFPAKGRQAWDWQNQICS